MIRIRATKSCLKAYGDKTMKRLIVSVKSTSEALDGFKKAKAEMQDLPTVVLTGLDDEEMALKIKIISGKDVIVMIIDTDATYKIGKMKFTSLPISIEDIRNNLGIFGYLLGRLGDIMGPTPLGISKHHELDEIFQIAVAAEECQKLLENSMETVYDMQELLDGEVNTITISMLDSIIHNPAIIVRKV